MELRALPYVHPNLRQRYVIHLEILEKMRDLSLY